MPTLDSVRTALASYWAAAIDTLPRVAGALLLLVAGWVAARLARRLAIRLLRFLKVDVLAEQAGMEDVLMRGDVRYTTVTILANLLYWFVLFASTLAALNVLGLRAADDLFERIVLYVPNVFVALVVLIFGTVFARFVKVASFTYLSNVGVEAAEIISAVAQIAVVIFVVSVALEQLAIGTQVLVSAFQIVFGAACLALALAFGLGGRDAAARLIERITKR